MVTWFYNVSPTTSTSSNYYLLRKDLRSRGTVKEEVPPGDGVKPVSVDVIFVPVDILDIDDVRQVNKICKEFF